MLRSIDSDIHNTFCFPFYLEKVENGAKLFEIMAMVIGSNDAEFDYLFKFLTTYYRQRHLTLGVFLEIFACEK